MSELAEISNFIRNIIDKDLESGKNNSQVVTRFPPEPNGYLHVGHAKSICLNFGLARDYKGRCHLRFDDTNPLTEDVEYMDAIRADVKWLGFDWNEHGYMASNYFDKFYECAVKLIKMGKAYVCSLSADEVREYRGTLTEPGKPSPDRNRTVEENLNLFERMRTGEFPDGKYTLRAKIDMSSGNINLRDPAIYRIRKAHHPATGDKWSIYPMYDFAHGLSDQFENITHSICTLEFQDHRPLYNWYLETLGYDPHPQQIEFARLNLNYTITSKRKLKMLVDSKAVSGWSDPRLPTLRGIRRRGFPAEALRNFCERIGVSKKDTVIDMTILEDCVRDVLNRDALRAMCVLEPIKLTITNYPEGKVEWLDVPNHPQRPELGTRKIPFSRDVYVESSDYMDNAPSKFFRLSQGREVRLRYACVVKCDEVIRNANGDVTELRCSYDPDTWKKDPEGRKVKGIIHWISTSHAQNAEVRLYDRLFADAEPKGNGDDLSGCINPESLKVLKNAKIDTAVVSAEPETTFQFERMGYFVTDKEDHKVEAPVLNRVVSLRDTWAKANS